MPGKADTGQLALDLLRDKGVALAPGTAFGSQGAGALRLSLAAAPAAIARGLSGLAEFLPTSYRDPRTAHPGGVTDETPTT